MQSILEGANIGREVLMGRSAVGGSVRAMVPLYPTTSPHCGTPCRLGGESDPLITVEGTERRRPVRAREQTSRFDGTSRASVDAGMSRRRAMVSARGLCGPPEFGKAARPPEILNFRISDLEALRTQR